MKFTVNPDDLTLGDLEDFEDATGTDLFEAFRALEAGEVPIKTLKALVWILRRRDEPDYTLDDTRKMTLAEMQAIEIEATDRPTDAAGSAS